MVLDSLMVSLGDYQSQSDFTAKLKEKLEGLLNLSPSDAVGKVDVRRTLDGLCQISIRINSQAQHFFAEAVSNTPLDTLNQAATQITRQLEGWLRRRNRT